MRVKLFVQPTTDDEDWFCVKAAYTDYNLALGPLGYGQVADRTDALMHAWCAERFPTDTYVFARERFFFKGYERVIEFRLRWDGWEITSASQHLR